MITEYIFGKVADDGIKKIKEWTNKDKAQRILLKCFKDCHKNNKEIILVDEKAILSIDSNKLQPNHRPDDVVKDIKEVCEKCILTDDSYKRKAIEIEIVYNYLKEANKDLLKLCHVDEDIHSVKDEILENRKILIKQHSEISEGIREINEKIRGNILPLSNFVEELNNSRIYCFIIIIVNTEVEEFLFQEIEEESNVTAEYRLYKSDGLYNIDVLFFEPVCQTELRDYLKVLDKVFSENSIGILGILTH